MQARQVNKILLWDALLCRLIAITSTMLLIFIFIFQISEVKNCITLCTPEGVCTLKDQISTFWIMIAEKKKKEKKKWEPFSSHTHKKIHLPSNKKVNTFLRIICLKKKLCYNLPWLSFSLLHSRLLGFLFLNHCDSCSVRMGWSQLYF